MRCEPANSIIVKLGGLTTVSRIIDGTPNGVMRWRMEKSKGGTGGRVPHWHIARLLSWAAENDCELRLTDFFPDEEAVTASGAITPRRKARKEPAKSSSTFSQAAAR